MSGILTSYQDTCAQTYDTTIMLISRFKAEGDRGQEARESPRHTGYIDSGRI